MPHPMPHKVRLAEAAERPGSLADQVYEQILTRIVDGHYPKNTKLPAETALSEDLGVSRPVLREALRHLREDGVITSRQGSGSYVQQRPDKAMLQFAPVGSIADIQRTFEFRAIVEAEAAALAAERWTDSTLARITAANDAVEACLASGQLGAEEDQRLHLAICHAADNHYFAATLASMRPQILAGMNLARSLSLSHSDTRTRLVQDEHRALLAAISARDANGARRAMRAHIENARARVFEGTHVSPGEDGTLS